MVTKEQKMSSEEIKRQFRAAKLEVSRQLYKELAAEFAKVKSHKTRRVVLS